MSIDTFKLKFQVAPIVLTGGIASRVPGSMVSLLALTQGRLASALQVYNGNIEDFLDVLQAYNQNIYGSPIYTTDPSRDPRPDAALSRIAGVTQQTTQTQTGTNLDEAFGAFTVIPGGTLCVNTVPKYPLASMTMAANAIVREPINVSLVWDTPMRGPNAWDVKLTTMQALKAMLDQHNNLGGTYTVMTPAYYYDNLILTALTDNSRGGNPLPQNAWRFDFERPMIVTEQDATLDQNMVTSKMAGGVKTDGLPHGPSVGSQGPRPTMTPATGAASLPVNAGVPGAQTPAIVGAPRQLPGAFTPASAGTITRYGNVGNVPIP